MSLSQLLAVGQSIKGGKDAPSPYRMTDGKLLPKFAPVGRPISLAPPPRPFAETAERFFAGRKAHKTDPAAATAPAQPVVAVAKPAAAASTGRGLRRLNPFASKSAAARPLVQAELSLDAVKVVRNDLSDADLELIPVQPAKTVEALPVSTEGASVGRAPTVWSRLTAKLFGLSRAWH